MDTSYREDIKAVLDDILDSRPDVKVGKAFGFPAYKIGRRVFCFVGGAGIAIKLPEDRVSHLVTTHDEMRVFEPVEGTFWREWVSIDRKRADDYAGDMDLFDESMQFVGS